MEFPLAVVRPDEELLRYKMKERESFLLSSCLKEKAEDERVELGRDCKGGEGEKENSAKLLSFEEICGMREAQQIVRDTLRDYAKVSSLVMFTTLVSLERFQQIFNRTISN
tara:strand:- start:1647 stop:1979 length:333 start_codon:yes stop_codon:yes gene_type:complete